MENNCYTNFELIESANEFFQSLRSLLCKSTIEEIWQHDPKMKDRLVLEYTLVDNKSDALGFYNLLDAENKRVLIKWYNNKITEAFNKTFD